ncbi:MAG TPA: SRPBCC domain-containing protein [Gemmatimonadaceae bacterium]
METVATAKISTPSDREIVITRVFDAPRAIVFDAWTRAEHVTHWWDPSGVRLAACEIDLRPNGHFRFVNGGPGGAGHSFAGIYREIEPPGRLVFTTRVPPSAPESVGTLVFDEHDGRTTLTMTIVCQSKSDRDALLAMRVDEGTARTLDNLDKYLGASRATTHGARRA